MSDELKSAVAVVKASLKRDLKHGEQLKHATLGPVTFTESCAELEKRVGFDATSIHVEHGGECKEVSVSMIHRTLPSGHVIKMQPESQKILDVIREAHDFLDHDQVKSASTMIDNLKKHIHFTA